jgi:hypothetical protein
MHGNLYFPIMIFLYIIYILSIFMIICSLLYFYINLDYDKQIFAILVTMLSIMLSLFFIIIFTKITK